MEERTTKRCYLCKQRWPISQFYPDASRRDGVSSKCKSCLEAVRVRYRERSKSARKAIVAHAKTKPCADCGRSYPPYVMDFDHRPGTTKKFGIAVGLKWSAADLLEEIDKCDLVCANCHRERTASRIRAAGGEPLVEVGASD